MSFFISATFWLVSSFNSGLASVYWPGGEFVGDTLANGQPFDSNSCHIAHRKWPLGAHVWVCNSKTCVRTIVKDRGPYGACDANGMDKWYQCHGDWKVMKKKEAHWFWRGITDLSKCVWDKLGSRRGIQRVVLIKETSTTFFLDETSGM